jgi:uncharacterized RDD family membrane protein YckC
MRLLMEIFLRIDGENTGPLTIYDVRAKLRSGLATPETKCWSKGMPEWVPLADFPPLEDDTLLRTPDEVDQEAAREAAIDAVRNEQKPRPWIRFWARMLDLSLYIVIVAIVVGLTGHTDTWSILQSTNVFVAIAIPGSWLFVEAALLHYVKTTPGKWVLNITLRRSDGEGLELGQALRRSFSVWWRGSGFGIFPLIIIGCALSNLSLKTRGKTPWDLRDDLDVTHGKIADWRVALYIALTLGAGLALLAIAGPPPVPTHP